jgi:hypothetical protein
LRIFYPFLSIINNIKESNMLKKLTILLTIILLSSSQFAQEKNILRPDGKIIKHKGDVRNLEVQSIKENKSLINRNNNQINSKVNSVLGGGVLDTLEYWSLFTPAYVNFGKYGQDWMLQWFVAPADLLIHQVGFSCYENADNIGVEVKVVKCSWTAEEFANAGINLWGRYEATGNGYNDITAFSGNPDATGGWTAIMGTTSPFGDDLWSDGGVGAPITPVGNTTDHVYQWVDMNLLGFYPQVLSGEIFGVAIKHTGTTFNANRIGYWSDDLVGGYTGWKFYANGRTDGDITTAGWWSREYTWDWVAEVEYTSDVPPSINSFTELPSGIELGPFTVDANITDVNPIGTAGVASAYINFSIDGGATWDSVVMSGTEPDFTGQIPAQSAGITVEYYISATDVGNLFSTSPHSSFYIFTPTPGVTTLVIYNTFSSVDGYPQDYYWGPNATFAHDEWAYGLVPSAVMDNYTDVIEICNGAPAVYNESVIRPWLEGAGDRNYFLAGQEWLGAKNSYVDSDYVAGSFEYDILGVAHSYNDITYDATLQVGQEIPTLVTPQAGTLFGQPLLDLFNSLDPAADSLMYNPVFEIGDDNWQDAFDVISGVEVDMMVETRAIGGVVNVQTLPTLAHHTLPAGNKVIFHAYDPLSLNTAVDDDYPYYYWVGYDEANSSYQAAFTWFGISLEVEEVGGIPKEFTISQNYPNPFNPTTKINFSIPTSSFVTLKVYDVLGREVTTLVNREMNNGNYVVDFDASNLASGLYIYKIQAGSFSTSMKMMLLK